MIRQLQLKIIAVSMGVLLAIVGVIMVTLNLYMSHTSTKQTEGVLRFIADVDGALPQPERQPMPLGEASREPGELQVPPDTMQSRSFGRFFYAKLDEDSRVTDIWLDLMFDYTQEEAEEYISAVLAQGLTQGGIDNLQYLIEEKDYGRIIVFAERGMEVRLLDQLVRISAWVAGISCAVLLVLVLLLSGWIVRPVQRNFERQRQFVSDAGHELKTPLTIVSANVDVLSEEIGESPWMDSIKSQLNRMRILITDLLTLARTDEGKSQFIMADCDLSKLTRNTLLEYEVLAFESGKELGYDIQEGIHTQADSFRVKQVVTILLDNAIKHSPEGAGINVSLKRESSRVILKVFNTGSGISDEERDKIFERFYRSDASRSRETGGYGLGLAIAKGIVSAHKGRITVEGEEGQWICFTISLPGV